jgi:hypothetical protein
MDINPKSAWKWIKLSEYILTDDAQKKALLLTLALHANVAGECWPSYERLSLITGIKSYTTLSNALKALRELKLISWVKVGGNDHKKPYNRYRLDQDAFVKAAKEGRKRLEPADYTPDSLITLQSLLPTV